MNIVVLGAGVQGTVFAVRLAIAGHQVTLIARPQRAEELRLSGATIQNLKTAQVSTVRLSVLERLPPDLAADVCLVTVRREQIEAVLPDLQHAIAIPRIVFLVNHANGSGDLLKLLGRSRLVLAFAGIAGDREGAIVQFLEIPQQRTVVEESAQDVAQLFRDAGFAVDRVRDMDAWLQRHAVFVTAMAGALYEKDCDAVRLAQDGDAVRRFIVAVREGWTAQDRKRICPAPFALRTLMCWVPLHFSTKYWSRLLASSCGDIYFARHTRHSPAEMVALAGDVRSFLREAEAPSLRKLLASVDAWPQKLGSGSTNGIGSQGV